MASSLDGNLMGLPDELFDLRALRLTSSRVVLEDVMMNGLALIL